MLSSIGKLLSSRTELDGSNDSLGTAGGAANEASEVLPHNAIVKEYMTVEWIGYHIHLYLTYLISSTRFFLSHFLTSLGVHCIVVYLYYGIGVDQRVFHSDP